eukprot:PhM_4_TR10043/c1_g1_i1/m.65549
MSNQQPGFVDITTASNPSENVNAFLGSNNSTPEQQQSTNRDSIERTNNSLQDRLRRVVARGRRMTAMHTEGSQQKLIATSTSSNATTTTVGVPLMVPQQPSNSNPLNSSNSSIVRRQRMSDIVNSFKGHIPPDSVLGRYWYCITALAAVYCYVVLTQVVVWDNAYASGAELAAHLTCSAVLLVDWYLHQRWIRAKYAAAWHRWLDLAMAAPTELVVYFVDVSYGGRLAFALLRALKLFRVPWMFQTSLPDAIDAHYV